jgi:HD-GYP domain-containing protein (c-di-GMP phosphodiesterase class II)
LGQRTPPTLRHGALLHDIGNIGIADSILLKPGGLSDWEFEEVRMHPSSVSKFASRCARLFPFYL